MPRFTVAHRYASSHNGRQFGPWEPGTEVELDEADAAWVERDSPGVFAAPEPEPEPERQAKPAPNRMAKGGRNRGA